MLPQLKTREFDESQHPRGQPDNAGQFGPGGGGESDSGASAPAAEKPPASTPYSKAEQAALGDYISDSTKLNNYLRNDKAKPDKELDTKAALINSALAKNEFSGDTTLWRGISDCKVTRDLRKGDATKLIGQTIPLGGFQSTTFSEDIALEFVSGYSSQVILAISAPKGTNVVSMAPMADNFAKQQEYLLGQGSLKITKVEGGGRGAPLYVYGTYSGKK